MAGARPVRQRRRVAVELVANDYVELANGLQAARDSFVERDFSRYVRTHRDRFFRRSFLEIGDKLVEPFEKVAGHFKFEKIRLERRGISGKSPRRVELGLIVAGALPDFTVKAWSDNFSLRAS